MYVCMLDPITAQAMDLEHMLHLSHEDPSAAKTLAERFITANGLRTASSGSVHDSNSAGLTPSALTQECYNTVYTLKVLSSNMQLRPVAALDGGKRATGSTKFVALPLSDDDDDQLATVITELCRAGTQAER